MARPTSGVRVGSDPAAETRGVLEGLAAFRAALFRLGLAGIVLGATVIRATMLRAQLPYMNYYDEHFPLKASAHQLATGTWDPGFYWYGSLVINLTTLTAKVLSWFGADGLSDGVRATVASPYTEVVAPPSLILAGRLVVMSFSVGTVWLVGLVAARLGGRRAGIVAAALAAVLPHFVQRASIVSTDPAGTFFVVLAVYAAVRITEAEWPRRWALLGGAAVGLGFTSKYTPLAAAVIVAVALITRSDLPRRIRATLLASSAAAAVGAAVISMPALVLRTSGVLADLRSQRAAYARFPASASYWSQLARSTEVGPAVLGLGCAGLVVLAVNRRTRPIALGCAAFAALFVSALSTSAYRPVRNVMPLVPLLCIGAGVSVAGAVGFLGRRMQAGPALRAGATLVVVGVLVAPIQDIVEPILTRRNLVDTRVSARRWLQDHVQPDERVVVAEELAFLPAELAAIDAHIDVLPQAGQIDPTRYDYVVMGQLEDRPWAWILGPHGSVTDGRAVKATFGTILTSCPRPTGAKARPNNCPPSPAPRAWFDNRAMVVIYAPVNE